MKQETIAIISLIPTIIYIIFIFMIPNDSEDIGEDYMAKFVLLSGSVFIFLIISVLLALIFGMN